MTTKTVSRTIILVVFMIAVCVLAHINPPELTTIIKDVATCLGIYIAVKGKGGTGV